MRCLLINPPFNMSKHIVNLPNTGLAYLAGALFNQGHELVCMEMNQFRYLDWERQFKQVLHSFQPQVVGFSVMANQTQQAGRWAQVIRRFYDGPIIVGGPNAICLKELLLERYPEIDVLVYTEGETTTIDLLQVLAAGGDISQVAGIIYRADGQIKRTPERPLMRNLDAFSWPLYDLFGFEHLTRYPLMTSRGCPFHCIFCYKPYGQTVRFRSVTDCLDELAWAKEHFRPLSFRVVDDAFNLQPLRAEEFCDLLMERNMKMPWSGFGIRADRVTPILARKMKASGCFSASVGFESLDPEVFSLIKKGETLEDLERGAGILREAGISVTGYLILGLPADTFQKAMYSYHKAWTMADRLGMSLATPFLGTELYEWVKKESCLLLDPEDFQGKGFLTQVAYETPGFSQEERLRAFHMTALFSVFLDVEGGSKISRFLKIAQQIVARLIRWNLQVLRFDKKNYANHLNYAVRRVRDMIKSRHQIHYDTYAWKRIPDGSWSLMKDGKGISVKSYS